MGTANDCLAWEIAAHLHLSQRPLFANEQPNGSVFFGDLFHWAEGKEILAGGTSVVGIQWGSMFWWGSEPTLALCRAGEPKRWLIWARGSL